MPNEDYLVDVPTNIGTITVIDVKRKNVPAGLKKPYEYISSLPDVNNHYNKIKDYLKDKDDSRKKNLHPVPGKLQYASIDRKVVTKGIKLTVFLLGYSPRSTGDITGVTKDQWNAIVKQTQKLLFDFLGPDAEMYVEPFSTDDKFQARFETYVMYSELKDLK